MYTKVTNPSDIKNINIKKYWKNTKITEKSKNQDKAILNGGGNNKSRDFPFPYKRIRFTDDDIHKMMSNLRKYNYQDRLIILEKDYKIFNLSYGFNPFELVFLCKGKRNPTILINKDSDYIKWNKISDMFNEDCRMRCKWFSAELSPMDYWNKYYDKIVNVAKKHKNSNHGRVGVDIKTPEGAHNLRETLYHMMKKKECTSFRPNNLVAIAQMFGSRKILDPSAGWGDRLAGAISLDLNNGLDYYCGIDPNPCVHRGYNEMIKFFGVNPKKYMLIESPFEDAKLPSRKKFDLIFTSPPYFDTEDYDPHNKNGVRNQSLTRYGSEKKWFENFLMVSLTKAWKVLESDGHMVIVINQRDRRQTYVKDMVMAVNTDIKDVFKNAKYMGVISYANEKIKNPQPMFIWKKTKRGQYPIPDTLFNSKRLYVRDFSIKDVPQMACIMNKKENMKWIANGSTKNFEQVYNIVSKYINEGYTMYPIIMKKPIKNWTEKKSEKMTDNIIGYVGYYEGKYLSEKFKDKYFIRTVIDENYRRKGYGIEIKKNLIEYIINKNIENVYSLVLKSNIASINLNKKLNLKIVDNIVFHNKKYVLFKIN